MRIPTLLTTLALLATPCVAQTKVFAQLNEIFVSHAGTDDQEYVEIKFSGITSFKGYMILVVEGDSTSAGTLDRAYDLSSITTPPSDGYLVVGGSAVSNVDLSVGTTNLLENGTDTFYLVLAKDVAAVTKLVGTNLDSDGDKATTIPSLATIIDMVAMTDGGSTDVTYDKAPVLGPDGSFLPAGIYRAGDAAWCTTAWLDFDDTLNTAAPRTPGAMNAKCVAATDTLAGTSCITFSGKTSSFALTCDLPKIGHTWNASAAAAAGAIGFMYIGSTAKTPGKFLSCPLYLADPIALVGAFSFDTTGAGTYASKIPNDSSLLGYAGTIQAAVEVAKILHLTNGRNLSLGY